MRPTKLNDPLAAAKVRPSESSAPVPRAEAAPSPAAEPEPTVEEERRVVVVATSAKLQRPRVWRVVKTVVVRVNGIPTTYRAGREMSEALYPARVFDILRANNAELELLE
jgi:hypothetical protein